MRLTTYHHTVPLSRNLGALTSLDPSGPARPVTGLLFTELICTIRMHDSQLLVKLSHKDFQKDPTKRYSLTVGRKQTRKTEEHDLQLSFSS